MAGQRENLDGEVVTPLKICMIGAGGFIGSHLCEKLMFETAHTVLAVDVYGDKIQHLLQPGQKWSDRLEFHKINIKHDSRLEGLIKSSDLVCMPTLSSKPCNSAPFFLVLNSIQLVLVSPLQYRSVAPDVMRSLCSSFCIELGHEKACEA